MTAGAEDRYSRQRLIPAWDQRRFAGATAIVVGTGALGNEVAKNLALLGFGRLVLCDPDTIAASNLSRTVLFTGADVGRSKVDTAAAALARIAPELRVETRADDLVRGVGLGELADAAVVLGCLDSRHARLQLLGRCALAGARLVDGGTHPWGGEVRVRVDPAEPCYGCTLSDGERAEQDAPVGCSPEHGAPQPASIVSTSLVASWMTTVAARLVLGSVVPWRLLEVDGMAGESRPVRARLDPQCPFHRPFGAADRLNVDHTATAGQLLARLAAGSEPLAWTLFPIAGICYHCNRPYNVNHGYRIGVLDCPECGRPIRLRYSQHVRDAEPGTPLRDLGVAPEEVLAVRLAEGDYQWVRLSPNGAPPSTPDPPPAPPPTSS